MPRLIAIDLTGEQFVVELRRAWDAGDAVLPLDPRLPAPAQQRLLEAMRPAEVVNAQGTTPLGRSEPTSEGDALVMATSGTTGEPKGVVLTQQAIRASAQATIGRLAGDSADIWWSCLPLAHIGGLSVVTRCLHAGLKIVHEPFSIEAAERALANGSTMTSLVPTTYRRLGRRVTAFRRVVLGGQAPPPHLADNVFSTYGLTETGSGVVYNGEPLDGVGIKINEHTSEILLHGPMLLRAYRDGIDPKLDGWLPTGDAGEVIGGRLAVRGRIAEMIITGGENVWPLAVENVIRESVTTVSNVAVVGLPDHEWGQIVTAFVTTSPDAGPAITLLREIRARVKSELADWAAPRQVVVVDSFPVTSLGKIRKEALDPASGESASL